MSTPIALVSAGGFGAAYMALTGLAIIWAVRVYGDDAATGVRTTFLTLGAGQAIGTPLVGLLADAWGLPTTFAFSAVASVGLLLIASLAQARQRPWPRSQGPGRLSRRESRSSST